MQIRAEIKEDYDAIFEVNKIAFGQDKEAKLVELIRKSSAFVPELSLVAVQQNKIVGHILFSEITIVDKHQMAIQSLALAPMAILPEFQRKGIGGQLIRSGLEKAKALQYQSVIVLGHENYYPKFGFEPAAKWTIKAPFEVPKNAFMGIELVTDGLKGINGTVQYSKAFETV